MRSRSLRTAELERNLYLVQGEIEAGLVFAAAAIEYQHSNPARSKTCRADAEEFYAKAIELLRQDGSQRDHPQELATMLDELRHRLDVIRPAKLRTFAAA
jgi:hypothetical protein